MSARSDTRKALREARMRQQAEEHEAMRAKLRRSTDQTCAMLAELRVAHLDAGHFVNGNFVKGPGDK